MQRKLISGLFGFGIALLASGSHSSLFAQDSEQPKKFVPLFEQIKKEIILGGYVNKTPYNNPSSRTKEIQGLVEQRKSSFTQDFYIVVTSPAEVLNKDVVTILFIPAPIVSGSREENLPFALSAFSPNPDSPNQDWTCVASVVRNPNNGTMVFVPRCPEPFTRAPITAKTPPLLALPHIESPTQPAAQLTPVK